MDPVDLQDPVLSPKLIAVVFNSSNTQPRSLVDRHLLPFLAEKIVMGWDYRWKTNVGHVQRVCAHIGHQVMPQPMESHEVACDRDNEKGCEYL